jgi:SulP family sulfate permease
VDGHHRRLLISLLGGSSVQIGGPAGAFIVIVYGIVERYGLANLLISTACAGVLLFALGLLSWGGWCATCRSAS